MDIEKIKEELIRLGFHEGLFNIIKGKAETSGKSSFFLREYKTIMKKDKAPMFYDKDKIGLVEYFSRIAVDISKDDIQFHSNYCMQIFDDNGVIISIRSKSDFFTFDNEDNLWSAIENSRGFIENEEIDN